MKLLDLVLRHEQEHGVVPLAVRASQGSGGQLHFYDRRGEEIRRSAPTTMASDWNGASVHYGMNQVTHRHGWHYRPADTAPASGTVEIDDELLNENGEICIVLPRNNVYNRATKALFICERPWLEKQIANGKWRRAIG